MCFEALRQTGVSGGLVWAADETNSLIPTMIVMLYISQ